MMRMLIISAFLILSTWASGQDSLSVYRGNISKTTESESADNNSIDKLINDYGILSEKEEPTWYESLIDNMFFWIGLLLPFILLGIFAYSVKRKIVDRNNRDKDAKT